MGYTENYVYTGEDSGTMYHAGFRFHPINIAQGAGGTLKWATLSYWVAGKTFDSCGAQYAKLYGEDADNADAFSVSLPSTRIKTAAVTPYALYCHYSHTPGWEQVNCLAQIQEIVDRPGWVYGNALALILSGYLGQCGTCKHTIVAYELGQLTRRGKLEINW